MTVDDSSRVTLYTLFYTDLVFPSEFVHFSKRKNCYIKLFFENANDFRGENFSKKFQKNYHLSIQSSH